MAMQAKGHRHLAVFGRGDKPWQWWALAYGHAQPLRFVLNPGPWRHRSFRFHLMPIHVERYGSTLELGLCLGKRTIYVLRHR